MLSAVKFSRVCRQRKADVGQLAEQLVRGGLSKARALTAVKNWQRGLFRPKPGRGDIERLSATLSVEVNALSQWQSCYRYAPFSARKARLVTELIAGRSVQEALDILKFTSKRATQDVTKVLKSAVADADEQQVDVDNLYVSEARVDDAGRRVGTKRWIAKELKIG